MNKTIMLVFSVLCLSACANGVGVGIGLGTGFGGGTFGGIGLSTNLGGNKTQTDATRNSEVYGQVGVGIESIHH